MRGRKGKGVFELTKLKGAFFSFLGFFTDVFGKQNPMKIRIESKQKAKVSFLFGNMRDIFAFFLF